MLRGVVAAGLHGYRSQCPCRCCLRQRLILTASAHCLHHHGHFHTCMRLSRYFGCLRREECQGKSLEDVQAGGDFAGEPPPAFALSLRSGSLYMIPTHTKHSQAYHMPMLRALPRVEGRGCCCCTRRLREGVHRQKGWKAAPHRNRARLFLDVLLGTVRSSLDAK